MGAKWGAEGATPTQWLTGQAEAHFPTPPPVPGDGTIAAPRAKCRTTDTHTHSLTVVGKGDTHAGLGARGVVLHKATDCAGTVCGGRTGTQAGLCARQRKCLWGGGKGGGKEGRAGKLRTGKGIRSKEGGRARTRSHTTAPGHCTATQPPPHRNSGPLRNHCSMTRTSAQSRRGHLDCGTHGALARTGFSDNEVHTWALPRGTPQRQLGVHTGRSQDATQRATRPESVASATLWRCSGGETGKEVVVGGGAVGHLHFDPQNARTYEVQDQVFVAHEVHALQRRRACTQIASTYEHHKA